MSYKRFRHLVDSRQSAAKTDRDIRLYLEGSRSSSITFGYIEQNLERAYGANLGKMFPHCRGFDTDNAFESELAAIPRALFESAELDSHTGSEELLKNYPDDDGILFFEQGFIASTASWFHAFKEQNPNYACLSYMYDDLAFYYMSEYENRLTRKLNSSESISKEQRERAQELIQKITGEKISKYNSQPISNITLGASGRPNVLVIDQSYGDASTSYGLADDQVFENMLLSAIRENPDCDIIVKTHPDTVYDEGKRTGYFTGLKDFGNVYFYRDAINPYCLFDTVEKVYVGTSGVGMEALLAGKEVVCFGAPFYAGWGLTDDRQVIPHRHRKRCLEELFYFTYVWYTHYHTPLSQGTCEIEEVLDFVLQHRTAKIAQLDTETSSPPLVSIITPIHNVAAYLDECILSLRHQSLKNIEIILLNDASTDSSLDIITRHADEDSRVKLVDLKTNIGQGFARNRGIQDARGQYLFFLDADDFLYNETVLEALYEHAIASDADMVRASKAFELVEDEHGDTIEQRPDPAERFFSKSFKQGPLTQLPVLMHNRHFWTFLYRRQFILDQEISFLTTQWEERPFLTKALLQARSISDAAVLAIVYRVRQASTARREKSLLDVERQLSNYESTVSLYRGDLAAPANNLDFALAFSFSQILHSIFYGFIWKILLQQPENIQTEYRQRIQNILINSGLSPDDLTDEPINVDTSRFSDYSYHYLFMLAREGRWNLIPSIVQGREISTTSVYLDLLEGTSEVSRIANGFLKYANKRLSYPRKNHHPTIKPQIVLHIGSTKSGSTFLQHFGDQNRAELLRQGVWYPEFGQFWQEARPHKQAGHSRFIHAAQHNDSSLLRHLSNGSEITGQQIHTVILSSEAFYLMDRPTRLLKYLEDFDLRVVAYLRRQDEWANSQYCEFVAGGAIGRISQDIGDWLKEEKTIHRMSYDQVLENWSSELGRDRVIARRYGHEYFEGGDLIRDFLGTVGIDYSDRFQQPDNSLRNKSVMGTRHVELMKHFNAMPFTSNGHYLNFVEAVEAGLRGINIKPSDAVILGSDDRAALMRRYTASNDYVAKYYLKLQEGEPLFSDDPVKADPRPSAQEKSYLKEEIAVFFAAYESCHADPVDSEPYWATRTTDRRFNSAIAAHSKSQTADIRYLATEDNLINRGYFRWRQRFKHYCFKYAKRVDPPSVLRHYYDNEAQYRERTNSKLMRIVSHLFRSTQSAYGVLEWRRQITPLVARVIEKQKGPEQAKIFISGPIEHARKLERRWPKLLGRLVYPMGDLA